MNWEEIYEEETGEPARLNKFPGMNNGKHREAYCIWLQKKLDSMTNQEKAQDIVMKPKD